MSWPKAMPITYKVTISETFDELSNPSSIASNAGSAISMPVASRTPRKER